MNFALSRRCVKKTCTQCTVGISCRIILIILLRSPEVCISSSHVIIVRTKIYIKISWMKVFRIYLDFRRFSVSGRTYSSCFFNGYVMLIINGPSVFLHQGKVILSVFHRVCGCFFIQCLFEWWKCDFQAFRWSKFQHFPRGSLPPPPPLPWGLTAPPDHQMLYSTATDFSLKATFIHEI